MQPKPEPKHTDTHAARPSQEWRGTRGARTQTRTPQHPRQLWPDAAKTRAQTHTPTPRTPARSGGMQAGPVHKQTQTLTLELEPTPIQQQYLQPGTPGWDARAFFSVPYTWYYPYRLAL